MRVTLKLGILQHSVKKCTRTRTNQMYSATPNHGCRSGARARAYMKRQVPCLHASKRTLEPRLDLTCPAMGTDTESAKFGYMCKSTNMRAARFIHTHFRPLRGHIPREKTHFFEFCQVLWLTGCATCARTNSRARTRSKTRSPGTKRTLFEFCQVLWLTGLHICVLTFWCTIPPWPHSGVGATF